ncbi:hypothetical protein GLOIN_2v1790829 [Rhizophagus clarus]|uniref:Reverse transcriptase domain-containing protein n=1 Tax=Rhizophagus clarus TaxID=94130 RepID=A0A8H3LY39_9GLOM|nr:hypothetical protein GLOIN_2v1790829 [Rhizophagus clarus]
MARSFYELVDININHKKCELIVINPSLPRPFLSVSLGTHEQDTIHPIQTEARYLGVWISPKNTRSLTKQCLRRTRNEFLHTIRHKKLSIAHVVYLINKVLYPKLIYLSQLTTFTKPEWDAIERPILALVKHTIGVQRSCPTSALYHEGIVGLYCLWMVVSTAGIMNLCTVLNDHNDATFTTLLRLRQAQLLMKLPDCCFSVHLCFRSLYMAASRSNLALFHLLLASDLHVNIKLDQIDRLSFSIKNIEFPLLDIWSKSYNAASITRINNKHSQFPLVDLSQLIAGDRSSLMIWKQYRTLAGLSRKGPKAKWFTQLERSVLESSDSRYLLPEYRSTQSTFYITRFLTPPSQDGHQKEWVAVQLDTAWLIGRITNKCFNGCKGLYAIDLYRAVYDNHSCNCSFVNDKDTHTIVRSKNSLIMFQLNVTFSNVQETPYWIIHSPL